MGRGKASFFFHLHLLRFEYVETRLSQGNSAHLVDIRQYLAGIKTEASQGSQLKVTQIEVYLLYSCQVEQAILLLFDHHERVRLLNVHLFWIQRV